MLACSANWATLKQNSKTESTLKMSNSRIDRCFANCADENRPALITFITAGDPDRSASQEILNTLVAAGSDLVELGMPFSDPMAEGIPIQLSSRRALNAGQKMEDTFKIVEKFRESNESTPIVLMGYYNPVYSFGNDRFLDRCVESGVDGLIIVDLPPEADDELCIPAIERGINFIRLATPTTDEHRLPVVLDNTTGFVYYVSITGITGSVAPDSDKVSNAVKQIKRHTKLPVAVGFGVKTPEQAQIIGRDSDGVVVGSAIVDAIKVSLSADGKATSKTTESVYNLVVELAKGVRNSKSDNRK